MAAARQAANVLLRRVDNAVAVGQVLEGAVRVPRDLCRVIAELGRFA